MAKKYREITPASVIFGIIFGIIMTMSFVYSGLKLSFTLAGSTIAAIVGFAFLRFIMRKGTILETNISQTVASGINIGSAGIIFTLPALLLIYYEMGQDFPVWQEGWKIMLAAIGGSLLGITVIIPLRKQMIEIDRLRFPSGTAVATILKTPGTGPRKAAILGIGVLLSGLVVIFIKFDLLPGILPVGDWIGLPAYTNTIISLSLMNIGAGMLAGKGGLPFALGGILAYWIIVPVSVNIPLIESGKIISQNISLNDYLYLDMLKPLGIGLLIGGALMGVIVSLPAISGAFKSLSSAAKLRKKLSGKLDREEIPVYYLYGGIIFSIIVIFISSYIISDISILRSIAISIIGTIWIAIAGLIVAQATGLTDVSPLSGLALIAVTLILAISGGDVKVAILVGVAVCVATSQCADMMQDLKTGQLVGAKPFKQQIVQYSVAWIGPVVAIITVFILWMNQTTGDYTTTIFGMDSYACQNDQPECLPAAQAEALKSMVENLLTENAPWDKYIAGGVLGAALGIFPVAGLGVLLGLSIYLPFDITLGFGIGCLITMLGSWIKSREWTENYFVPLAAGFIIGEAILGLIFSIINIIKMQ